MSAVLSHIGTFLLSLFVALLAALQLADYFGTGEEFILVLMVLPIFVVFTIVVFMIASALGRNILVLDATALVLAGLAFAPLVLPAAIQMIAGRSTNPYSMGKDSIAVVIELVVPAVIAVLVQWGLVRRRWQRLRGESTFTSWPWLATILGGLIVLNPLGLDFLGQAVAYHPGNMMRDIARMIAFGGIGVLIATALIEYYIRGRMQRRQQSPAEPVPAPG